MFYFQKYWVRLLAFFLFFVLGMSIASISAGVVGLIGGVDSRTVLLVSSTIQNVVWFALPAILAPFFFCNKPLQFTGIKKAPALVALLGIVIVYLLGIPALNQIIYYNANMHLPDFLSGLEEIMRSLEEQAEIATETLLGGTDVVTLIVNVLVIGVLTGICEELCFRAGLQRTLLSTPRMNHHLAIWIAAIIFSLMHMQMFGFVPRMLLGAFFGYIYYWTGSIWVAASAHALNNSIVVVTVWLQKRGLISGDLDAEAIGTVTSGIPWIALCSTLLTTLFFIYLRKYFFNRGKESTDISTDI